MIGKILTEDKKDYYSVIFAYINADSWREEVVILNEDKTKIIKKRVYDTKPYIERKVFVVDASTDNWEKKQARTKGSILKGSAQGYDWIIDKLSSMNFDEEDLKKAKAIDENVTIAEWNLVSSERDIESLQSAAWDFHDSHIHFLNYDCDTATATVVFKNCWGCSIELEFSEIETIHLRAEQYTPIFSASILFDGGFVYWVDDSVQSVEDIADEMTRFKSRVLKWKIIIDKD